MENKRDKFVRLAESRVTKTIKSIRLVGNLANKSVYEFSEADVKKIFSAMEKEIRIAKERFSAPSGEADVPVFKLEGKIDG